MKVLILGAGQVGRTAAYHLAREPANEVTVVDTDEEAAARPAGPHRRCAPLRARSFPAVLEAAGIVDTDILVALTSSDEVNMIACEIASALYRTPKKIARIRASEYTSQTKLFAEGALAVDVWISPEQLVTEYIERLIHNPGALQIVDFADGLVLLVACWPARADCWSYSAAHARAHAQRRSARRRDLPQRTRDRRRGRNEDRGERRDLLRRGARQHQAHDERAAPHRGQGEEGRDRWRRQHRPAARTAARKGLPGKADRARYEACKARCGAARGHYRAAGRCAG